LPDATTGGSCEAEREGFDEVESSNVRRLKFAHEIPLVFSPGSSLLDPNEILRGLPRGTSGGHTSG
jgi:hypothetical protein